MELLPAVALDVEDERMEVDLPATLVAHDESRRKPGIRRRIVAEFKALESRSRGLEQGAIEGEVEVRMWPRLLANERVDTPAAVDPGEHSRLFEGVKDVEDVLLRHAVIVHGVRAVLGSLAFSG